MLLIVLHFPRIDEEIFVKFENVCIKISLDALEEAMSFVD